MNYDTGTPARHTLELIVVGDRGGQVHFPHLEEPNPKN
jgi:hypothetical protein